MPGSIPSGVPTGTLRSTSSPIESAIGMYPCDDIDIVLKVENEPKKPEELTFMLPGTIWPVKLASELGSAAKSEGGMYRKFIPMVSVQLEEQCWVAVKVAQALTSSSMLSAQIGAEQNATTAKTINNLRI
jgi:hypothetical protein